MKGNQTNWKKIRWTSVLALLVAALVPFAAFAQTNNPAISANADTTAQATMPSGQGSMNGQGNMNNPGRGNNMSPNMMATDTQDLTDEQKAVYEKALTLYEQIEDSVLADLVTANVVTQADVDAYIALREADKSLDSLDMSAWTAEQYKGYYEALAQSGDERKVALQALADAGQLTQAQADAISAQGQATLWQTLNQNAATNKTIQIAQNTLQQARQAMNATLRDAGITVNGRGNGMNGNMPGPGGNQQPMGEGGNEQEDQNEQEDD